MSETNFEPFCQMAKEMGATHARVISPQSVVTAAWVRLKCQYGCVRFAHRRLALRPLHPFRFASMGLRNYVNRVPSIGAPSGGGS